MNCCYIGPTHGHRCCAPAKWRLWLKGDHPSLTTESCTEHVGKLLSDGDNFMWPLEKGSND